MVSALTVIVPEDIPMEDSKALVIHWHEKHYSATKMYTKLLARTGEACPADSTITNWIRAFTRGEDIHGHASGCGRLPDDRVDTLVINALEYPFSFSAFVSEHRQETSHSSMATFERQGLY
jgi:predicted alpha/beta-fold hydrolase